MPEGQGIVARALDRVLAGSNLPDVVAEKVIAKTKAAVSLQPRAKEPEVDMGFAYIMAWAAAAGEAPCYGSQGREIWLRNHYKKEPILAGAVNTLIQKLKALPWTMRGPKDLVQYYANVLRNAEMGEGWSALVSKAVEDFLTTDNGAWIERARAKRLGNVAQLNHFDSACIVRTPSHEFPAIYMPRIGPEIRGPIKVPHGYLINFTSMPNPDESWFGRGYCLVSRLIPASWFMIDLHKYERQKIGNLPPEALFLTNLEEGIMEDALKKQEAAREAAGMTRFKGVVFVSSGDPANPARGELVEISRLPEQFDRAGMVELWVKTIALNAGVDVGELWLVTHPGATKALGGIQHAKARGKFKGELTSTIEREVNLRILPRGVSFSFDPLDDEQDFLRARIYSMKTANFARLVNALTVDPKGNKVPVFTREELRRLAVEEGICPARILETMETEFFETDVQLKAIFGPRMEIRWENGNLSDPIPAEWSAEKSRRALAWFAEYQELISGDGSGREGLEGLGAGALLDLSSQILE